MDDAHIITVGDAYIAYARMQEPTIRGIERLFEHQVETIRSTKNVIVLDAPTGSGKTLAALARVIIRKTPAIFIYPTNALIKDQIQAIHNLLQVMGYKVNLINHKTSDKEIFQECDVYLLHLTSETLEEMAGTQAKGTVMERLLNKTSSMGKMRIVLTNPDTLFLIASGKYARHGRIAEEIDKFKTIVVDEFHLYAGPALARLFFLLNDLRSDPDNPAVELVFLSATHNDTVDLLENSFSDLQIIQPKVFAEGGPDRRKIRWESKFSIRTQSSVMRTVEKAEEIAQTLVNWYETSYNWDGELPEVKVLGIFASVAFAIQVAKKVQEILDEKGFDPSKIVFQQHGLVPKSIREQIHNHRETILIGTSAIEVGVDFNVPFLVVEAHDLASFLQRVGRGGRHAPCQGTLYVPLSMASRLNEQNKISYSEFISEAKEAFIQFPSYADFLCSRQSRNILVAMALAGSTITSFYRKKEVKFDYSNAKVYFEILANANKYVRTSKASLNQYLTNIKVENLLKFYPIQVLAKFSFLRGVMNSVVVRLPKDLISNEKGVVFTELDIFDVFRLSGHLEPIAKHWNSLPQRIRGKHLKDEVIFIVEGLGQQDYPRVALDRYSYRKNTGVFDDHKITIKIQNPILRETIEKLLNGRNLVFNWPKLNRNTDYRIPRLYCEDGGGLVIGDWALVANYLNEQGE